VNGVKLADILYSLLCVCVSVSTQSSLQQWRRLAGVYSVCGPNVFDSRVKRVGIYVSLAFWRYSQVEDRSRVLGEKCNTYITQNVFSTALRAAMTSLSFMDRRTTPQRGHLLVDTHQTVRLLPSEACICIRQCSLGQARSVIVYFSFTMNTATIASKMTVAAVN